MFTTAAYELIDTHMISSNVTFWMNNGNAISYTVSGYDLTDFFTFYYSDKITGITG